jgi:hypothetical protein
MSRSKFIVLGAVLALLGGTQDPYRFLRRGGKKYEPMNPKMPLNEDEIKKLSELSGKEKKAFVHELKEKYGK